MIDEGRERIKSKRTSEKRRVDCVRRVEVGDTETHTHRVRRGGKFGATA
jgi:hypothetical protein